MSLVMSPLSLSLRNLADAREGISLAVQITRQEVTQSSKRENTVDSAQLLALEAENRRLRKEAEEHEETVRLLKK